MFNSAVCTAKFTLNATGNNKIAVSSFKQKKKTLRKKRGPFFIRILSWRSKSIFTRFPESYPGKVEIVGISPNS